MSVTTAHELDTAVTQIAHNVASTIAASILWGIFDKRILHKYLFCLLGTIQVTASHLRTANPQFTYSTCRQTMIEFVYNIEFGIEHCRTNRNVFQSLRDVETCDVTDGLRRAIGIGEDIVLRWSQRCQFLTTCHQRL